MGALHEGQLAPVAAARSAADSVAYTPSMKPGGPAVTPADASWAARRTASTFGAFMNLSALALSSGLHPAANRAPPGPRHRACGPPSTGAARALPAVRRDCRAR